MAKQLTYEDAALALHCSPRNVRRLLKRHRINTIRIGHRTVRIPSEKIGRLVVKLALSHKVSANGKGRR
jgi:excisionase family DNA binding protein